MSTRPRRVVTGHTPEGVSVVVSDGPVPVSRELPDDGVAFHEMSARRSDFAFASAAAQVALDPNGACARLAVAVGAATEFPLRSRAAVIEQTTILQTCIPAEYRSEDGNGYAGSIHICDLGTQIEQLRVDRGVALAYRDLVMGSHTEPFAQLDRNVMVFEIDDHFAHVCLTLAT